MRASRANYNLMAVSAMAKETGINIFQDADLSLLVSDSDYFDLEWRRENNAEELNGMEEADEIYSNGATGKAPFTFNKLQAHHAGFLLAYGLGVCQSAIAADGYLHTITPIVGDEADGLCNPSFTTVQRLGKIISTRRFATCVVNSLTLTFTVDDWVKGSGDILSTGKYEDSVIEETVSALNNATSLSLAVNGVEGATAQERLDSIQVVRAMHNGGMQFLTVTAVSATTPADITIESLGGDGLASADYKILYTPTHPAWCTFPTKEAETPLRVSQMCLYLGGTWDGAAFVGGKKIASDMRKFEYTLNNDISMEFTPCAGGTFAGKAFRGARNQKISLNRELRDMLLQRYMTTNEYFGLHLLCEGDEYATGQPYTLELIFPRLGLLGAPLSTDNRRIAEAGDLQVLADATHGSVIAKVKNEIPVFAG